MASTATSRNKTGRYTLLAGRYQVHHSGGGSQPRPDGDTVKFIVDAPDRVRGLPRFSGVAPHITAANGVSLRLETIDALETHFPTLGGRGPEVHQEMALALVARDALLKNLGFRNLQFDERGIVTAAERFEMPGYVLASGVEGNGRVVAFVFSGKAPRPDGSSVFLETPWMEKSANIASLKLGLAYATFYSTQPMTLIQRGRKLAAEARASKKGVFAKENLGLKRSVAIAGLESPQRLVAMPKLFRRLANYFAETEGALDGFDAWVRAESKRDDPLILPSGERGNLHDLYRVRNGRIALIIDPADVTVLE
jgi:hypothetical protein